MRLDISIGDIDNGNLNILNNDRATKAFSAVSLSLGSVLLRLINVYVVNVANATCRLRMRGKEGENKDGEKGKKQEEREEKTREEGNHMRKKDRERERREREISQKEIKIAHFKL